MVDRQLTCDRRIAWVLAACRQAWAQDRRSVATALPIEEIARATAQKVVTRIALHYLREKHGLK
jgi:hypothetical protein